MTLVVNLFGGPGTGKSTTATETFAELKHRGVNCEYVGEYAKDVVWARTTATLDNQIYVFAKQHHRIFRLLGQVDVVITDCPLFLSLYYGSEKSEAFKNLVWEEFSGLENLNIFLKRVKPFNPAGRLQSEEEARQIDVSLRTMLNERLVPYTVIAADRSARMECANLVHQKLLKEGRL